MTETEQQAFEKVMSIIDFAKRGGPELSLFFESGFGFSIIEKRIETNFPACSCCGPDHFMFHESFAEGKTFVELVENWNKENPEKAV